MSMGMCNTPCTQFKHLPDAGSAGELLLEAGRKDLYAIPLNNIAGVYRSWEQYDRAIEYYRKALKIDEEPGRTANTANRLNNIGSVYHEAGQYAEAIDFFPVL